MLKMYPRPTRAFGSKGGQSQIKGIAFIPTIATLLFGTFHVQAQDSITITVIPALAPNVYGSPNWNAWVSNATTAIRNGYTSFGDPTSPSFYQRTPGI